MAIAFKGGAHNSVEDATITVTHGLTINSGDVIIATAVANGSDTVISSSDSFTEIFGEQQPGKSNRYKIWSKVAGSSEPSSYTWTLDSSQRFSVVLQVFSGVDNSTLFDVTPSASTRNSQSGSSTPASAPSVTTSNSGAMGICSFLSDSGWVNFTSYTNSYINETEVASDSDRANAMVNRLFSSAGPTGETQATLGEGADDWTGLQYALKPAAAATTTTTSSTTTTTTTTTTSSSTTTTTTYTTTSSSTSSTTSSTSSSTSSTASTISTTSSTTTTTSTSTTSTTTSSSSTTSSTASTLSTTTSSSSTTSSTASTLSTTTSSSSTTSSTASTLSTTTSSSSTTSSTASTLSTTTSSSITTTTSSSSTTTTTTSPPIIGTVCSGHVTGVEEDYAITISGNWSGTGEILGSGDTERINLEVGEYLELDDPWNLGVGRARLTLSKYLSGDSGVSIKYKSGSSPANCIADSWHDYSAPWDQDGWVLIRLEK